MFNRILTWKSLAIALVAAAASLSAGLGYIGYFGGELFTPVTPTGPIRVDERDLAVVFFSGDMGPHVGLGPSVVAALSAHGLRVTAVNSLVYFRIKRTPREARALVIAGIERTLVQTGAKHLILVGQSFGSDMLQQSLPGLPPALRARVAFVVLTVPGVTLDYQAFPGGLWSSADQPTALPTGRKLDWVPSLCIYGAAEPDSLCPYLTMPNVTRLALPGDHFLRRDPDPLARAIIAAIDRIAATLPKV